MSTLNALLSACQTEQAPLLVATRERVAQWDSWLQPLSGSSPAGEEAGYDGDFQQMREEVNKLSGADTGLICRLAEKLLTTAAKDIRVGTYYRWAKLHREGEQGLACWSALDHCCTRSVTAAERPYWNGWQDRA